MTGKPSHPGGRSVISRADLLWGFFAVDENQHLGLAELLGFEQSHTRETKQENVIGLPPDMVEIPTQPPEEESTPLRKSISTSSSYYRIVGRQLDETHPGAEARELALPDWFTQASPTILEETESRIPDIHRVEPLYVPLMPWARLLPLLQRVLGDEVSGTQPDEPKLVRQVAQREFIRRIPRKHRQGWATAARVLVDINGDNFPYRRDFIHLRERLKDVRGDEGLDIQYIHDEPGGCIARYEYGREIVEPWKLPEKGSVILILSDMGMQTGSRRELYGWLVFGQLLKVRGFRPTVLMPVAERNIDKRLLRYFDCIVWDRNSPLKRVKGTYRPEQDKQDHTETIDLLLAHFFAAVRVDMGLLRAVRQMLPAKVYDIGHEASLWRHPAVNKEGDEWGWQTDNKPGYLEDARIQLAKLERAQQDLLVELIGRYHALYPDELYFEAMYGLMTLGMPIPKEVRAATEKFMQDMVATYKQHSENLLLHGWVKRHLVRHEDPTQRKFHRYWLPLLAFSRVQEAKDRGADEIEMPDGLSPDDKEEVLRFVNQHRQTDSYVLRQSGEELVLSPEKAVSRAAQSDEWEENASMGAGLLTVRLNDTHIFHTHHDTKGNQHQVMLDLAAAGQGSFRFPATGQHEFQIGRERFVVEVKSAQQLQEPWMRRVSTGSSGLCAQSRSDGDYCWHPPQWQTETGMLPGIWHYLPLDSSKLIPDWATEAGRDRYGLYADAEIAGITQRFRWIEPTSFQMGSPKEEEGRNDNETQHQVILTQGYWLADTACTQAVWQAVMGENPSKFKDKNNPVENVNWDDIRTFLQKLNEGHPELDLRLPTEAEWENACRAGTTGAFHFEGELTLEKVNYRGLWEYSGANWGDGAVKRTAPVKNYPPNAWGLYEMHGNVWEWCRDWYGEYPLGPVVDPQGAESGTVRVLRGGSWINYGRNCRSAYRDLVDPAVRVIFGGYVGFRLARGLELPVRQGAGQQPVGTPASERGGHKRGMGGGAVDRERKPGKSSTRKNKNLLRAIMDKLKK